MATWLLGIWLIAKGVSSLGNGQIPRADLSLSGLAVAAGVLILWQPTFRTSRSDFL